MDKCKLIYGDNILGITAGEMLAQFSYGDGGLTSLKYHKKEWIYRMPVPAFWRALTDNDRGSRFHLKSGMWIAADTYRIPKSMTISLDGQEIPFPKAPENNGKIKNVAESVKVTCVYETLSTPSTTVEIAYTFSGDGSLILSGTYHGKAGLPELPCFGVRIVMPTLASGFTYLGLKGETYPDRLNDTEDVAVRQVEGLPVTRHLNPQDCGMHMQTRELLITRNNVLNNADHAIVPYSLKVSMVEDTPFAFSCIPYTPLELESATHQEELPLPRRTVLTLYGAVRGVGGIDSWGADVRPDFHVSAQKDLHFSVKLEEGVSSEGGIR